MQARYRADALIQPLASWTRLAMTASEMMTASAQVIGHRLLRMANAGPELSRRDRREFTAMGLEKLEAAAASLLAMSGQMAAYNWQVAAQVSRQMLSAGAAIASLMASQTAAQAIDRQARTLRIMRSMSSPLGRMSGDTARLLGRGLTPIRSRAVRNAARLGRR